METLEVQLDGETAVAINYPDLTGICMPGDRVLVNTTAAELGLGTGGYHFVVANLKRSCNLDDKPGHIMKLRYTPLQGRVCAVEEPDSPHFDLLQSADGIDGLPVAVGSLHSMLAPLCVLLKHLDNRLRIVYLMSDGAALPITFSRLVRELRQHNLLAATITFGNAFGGDYEAVNIFSALLAAKHVCNADCAIVLMGPGITGTASTWGTTALEQGLYLDGVSILGGIAVAIPRISFSDERQRHFGLSHHFLTSLERVTQRPCHIGLPETVQSNPTIRRQLNGLHKHMVQWIDVCPYAPVLSTSPVQLMTMQRTVDLDPAFFQGCLAAGITLFQRLLGE